MAISLLANIPAVTLVLSPPKRLTSGFSESASAMVAVAMKMPMPSIAAPNGSESSGAPSQFMRSASASNGDADACTPLSPVFGGAFSPGGSLLFVSMLATSCLAHYNAAAYYDELENPTLPRYNRVVYGGFAMAVGFFVSIAAAGHRTFGAASQGLAAPSPSYPEPPRAPSAQSSSDCLGPPGASDWAGTALDSSRFPRPGC
mgnify:CR=1 FL=1